MNHLSYDGITNQASQFAASLQWSEALSSVIILNARAFIVLLFCLLVLRVVKGSSANRHFLLLASLLSLLLLPISTRFIPAITVEMAAVQAAIPDIAEPVVDYLSPIYISPQSQAPWFGIVFVVFYFSVSTLLLLKVTWENLLVYILARISPPLLTRHWRQLLERYQHRLGIAKPINLRVSKHIAAPITWGNSNPVIILPYSARHWSPHVVRSTMLHELAHIRRRDWLVQQVCRVICALFWINPVCWYALRKLGDLAEAACDDFVLYSGIKNSHYANDLLNVARNASQQIFTLASIPMAAPLASSALTHRIKAILSPHRARHPNSFWHLLTAWLFVCGLILPFSSLKPEFVQVIETKTVENTFPLEKSGKIHEASTINEHDPTNIAIEATDLAQDTATRFHRTLKFNEVKDIAISEIKTTLSNLGNDPFRNLNVRLSGLEEPNEEPSHKIKKQPEESDKPKPTAAALAKSSGKSSESAFSESSLGKQQADLNFVSDAHSNLTASYPTWFSASATQNPVPWPGYVTHAAPVTRKSNSKSIIENYSRDKIVYPKYPSVAIRRGIEGEVIVEFSIDEEGRVQNPQIIEAQPSSIFNRNVLRAIKEFTFTPHRIDGAAVAVKNVREVFVFKIEA